MKKFFISIVVAATLAATSAAIASPYTVDASHSNVNFTVRHLIAKMSGEFKEYEGTFKFDEKKNELSDVNFKIKAKSISTNNEKRDDHLRGEDFFNVDKFETLTFTAAKGAKISKKGKLKGDLTIHGVTKPVSFDVEFLGAAKDPWGNQRTAFTASTKISRKDYGLTWNKALDAGGVMLGDEVALNLQVEAIQDKPADAAK